MNETLSGIFSSPGIEKISWNINSKKKKKK